MFEGVLSSELVDEEHKNANGNQKKPRLEASKLRTCFTTALSSLLLSMMMASAPALAAAITTTAFTSPSGLAAAPLVVASRLDNCSQGMGLAGTSFPRPLILDPRQGFPQFMRLSICYNQKYFLFDIKIRGKAIQDSTVNLLFRCSNAVLSSFITKAFSLATKSLVDSFTIAKVSSLNFFFTLS